VSIPVEPRRSEPLRVLDLSGGLPAAYCGKLLAGFGAEVLCVVPPGGSADGQFFPGLDGWLGEGRETRELDLKQDADVAHELVRSSDVCLVGFRPGSRLAQEYAPARLAAESSRLVACWIRGFSQSSPLAEQGAHDLVFQARYGWVSPGASPPPVPAVDLAAGLMAAFRISAVRALPQADASDRAIVVAMDEVASSWGSLKDHFRGRWFPSYGGFLTRDGAWIALGFEHEDRQWKGLCDALGLEAEASIGAADRQRDSVALRERVAAAIASFTRNELDRRLSATAVAWTHYPSDEQ
jgi:crotonobetainyl-CoA:carnitine CoA-transferase CaiB-like acyl-CoA transferase